MADHICESCAEGHIITPATTELKWEYGSKWLCDKCYSEIVRR